MKHEVMERVTNGYYVEHPKGQELLSLDLDGMIESATTVYAQAVITTKDELAFANKRIDYLEQREADLIVEITHATNLLKENSNSNETHVNPNDKKD